MCYKLIISFLCVFISVTYAISADTAIIFRVTRNGNHDVICNVSNARVNVKDGAGLLVSINGEFHWIRDASCSLENSKKSFLTINSFKQRNHLPKREIAPKRIHQQDALAVIKNATEKHNGKWNCTFVAFMRIDNFTNDGINDTTFNCRVYVNVEPPPFVLDKLLLCYVILGVVGIVALIIIGVQCGIIRHLRRKVAISKRSSLPHLERRPAGNIDRARYSAMPGQKRSSRKKREESGIYQSLENLHMTLTSGSMSPYIRHRPPMPLPSDDNDEHIYDGGQTLRNMFAPPTPPSVHTLPKYNSMTNLNKPVQMEDYDYPDSAELLTQSKSKKLFKCRSGKKAPLPPPPRPDKPKPQKQPRPPAVKPSAGAKAAEPMSTGGPGGASMMAELGSRLKLKKNSQQTPNSLPSVTHQTPNLQSRPFTAPRPEIQSEMRTQTVLFNKKTKEIHKKAANELSRLPPKPSELRQETRRHAQDWPSEAQTINLPNTSQRYAQEPQSEPSKPQDFRPQNWSPNTPGLQDWKLQNWTPEIQHLQARTPQNWSLESQGLQDYRPQNEKPKPPAPFGSRPAACKPLSKALPNTPPNTASARSPPISRVSPMVKDTPVRETSAFRVPAPEEPKHTPQVNKPPSSEPVPTTQEETIYEEMEEKHNPSDYDNEYDIDDEFENYDDLKAVQFYLNQ